MLDQWKTTPKPADTGFFTAAEQQNSLATVQDLQNDLIKADT